MRHQGHPGTTAAGPRSWLCPEPADRARAVDMEERLKPYRRLSFVTLAIALLLGGPWIGWWTIAPLGIAAVGFQLVDARLARSSRPEVGIVPAWLLTQATIAGSIALTGGPERAAVSWLAIPLVTLPARFTGHAVRLGVLVTAALMVVVTLGVDPDYVVGNPPSLVGPLALLIAIALLSSALMKSDLEHRSSAVID